MAMTRSVAIVAKMYVLEVEKIIFEVVVMRVVYWLFGSGSDQERYLFVCVQVLCEGFWCL